MQHICRYILSLALVLAMTTGQTRVLAQRLYNKDKDDQAQETRKLATEVESGAVFDKQLKNLKLISRQDFATYFMNAKRNMETSINSYDKWGEVARRTVLRVKRSIDRRNPYDKKDMQTILTQIKKEKDAAAAKLKELKGKVEKQDETVPVMFERLGDVEALFSFAADLLDRSSTSAAPDQLLTGVQVIEQTLGSLKALYNTYLQKMDDIDRTTRDLIALRVPMQKVALARLQVEEQHLKNIGAILARREADKADVILLIQEFEKGAAKLGLAKSLDDLAAADTTDPNPNDDKSHVTIESTISEIVEVAEDAQERLKEAQDNQKGVMTRRRESATTLGEKLKALEQAEQTNNRRLIARARKAVAEAEEQLAQVEAEEKQARKSVVNIKGEIVNLRKTLATTLDLLYVAAALAAHGTTPANLANLRLAQEEHRYSIKKSAVLAQAYEATISTGTQRLAMYYKGGIKPEKIAQLIYSAAQLAIPPAILAQ
jgi:hypothetical protein